MKLADLDEVAKNLAAQDNLASADPIFYVQQRRRIYGFDVGYSEGTCFMDEECNEWPRAEIDDLIAKAREEAEGDEDRVQALADDRDAEDLILQENNLTAVGYRDLWENVQPFLTRVGAEHYKAINGHNLSHPRIYVDSAFRNAEWQAVRALLLARVADPVAER
jgi:hypothetical protein